MPEPTVPSFPGFMPTGPRVPMANVTQVPVAAPPPVTNASTVVGPDGVSPEEAEFRARRAAAAQAQAELEAKHGKFGVAATQLGRGALDALLAPGALAGLMAEAGGYVTGWQGLEDFGRGLGQAAQGKELLGVLSATPEIVQGEGAAGYDAYRGTLNTIHEQEQAWPMLSATSRLAGSVAFGVGTGALAGHAGLGSQALVGGIEGAGYGAQSGYEKNAPLRDVVTASLIGGTLGVGLPVAVGKGLPYVQSKAREGLQDFAGRKAFKAAAGNYSAAYDRITRFGKDKDRLVRVGQKMLKEGVDVTDLDELRRGVLSRKSDAFVQLDAVASSMDEAGAMVSVRDTVANAQALIKQYRAMPFGTYKRIADRLESEIAPLVGRDAAKFSEYWNIRKVFDDILYSEETGKPIKGALGKALEKLRGTIDEPLTKAVDSADESVGKLWRQAKENYGDYADLDAITAKHIQNREKNRAFSASDHGLGIGGAILSVAAGDVSGLTGAAIGAGLAGANKIARERGPGFLAKWADALAGHADDAGHSVSVAAAGGKEAQEAITAIDRARRAILDAGETAGDNPTAQQAARHSAQQQVGDELLEQAGPLNANWIKNPPNTLQKVLHRTQILDQVAGDVSSAVQKVAALRPTLAGPLAQRRLGKLLEDADGPAAIGGLQMRIARLMEQLPRSDEGQAMRLGLKAINQQLQTAGKAEAMRVGHDLSRRMTQAAAMSGDAVTKSYAQRAAQELAQELSGEAWGTAGKYYATLSKAPADVLAALSDPKALRGVLRNVETRGKLVAAVRSGLDDLRQAQKAAAELVGAGKPAAREAADEVGRALQQARTKGVAAGTEYLKSGMRDAASFRGAFKGATPDEVQQIALGKLPSKNTGEKFKPVELSIYDDGTGKVHLSDGRHRMIAAKEAGAEEVVANVSRFDSEGNLVSETLETWPIGPAKAVPDAPFVSANETDLKALERLFEQAEEAVTLDGGPVGRVLDWFGNKLDERVAGSLGSHVSRQLGDQPGHAAETAVLHAVQSRLSKVAKVLHTAGHTAQHTGTHLAQGGAIGAAMEGKAPRAALAAGVAAAAVAPRLLTPQEKTQQYKNRVEMLAEVTSTPDLDIHDGLAAIRMVAPGLEGVAAQDFNDKLQKLYADMPKPKQTFRGVEMPSSQDVRLANAMYEATVQPLSVFDDFAAGNVDYDKVKYCWAQYPGLQVACQMGIQDILFQQMDEAGRAHLPENLITQVDLLLGLDGALQPTIAPEFVRAVDAIAADARSGQKPRSSKPLELPTSKPTAMQRVAGAMR